MTLDLWFWACAILASFLVGAAKGGLPGVGILAVPVLAQAISPTLAAGILLPILIVSDWYGLWMYRKNYNTRIIKVMLLTGLIGVAVGWATAHITNTDFVKIIVGIIGLSFFVDTVLKLRRDIKPASENLARATFWGSIAGFTSFVAHAGGPPYQMYVLPLKLDKMTYAGTTTILFAIINVVKLPPYWFLGQINVASLALCAKLAPVALVGAFAGYHLTKLMPEKIFFRFVETALFLLSLKLLYDGICGLTKV